MINLFSIRCSMAFAPYIAESATAFLTDGAMPSRVVRQGGSGLIMRAGEDVVLRHQNREAFFTPEDARHYLATVQFRCEAMFCGFQMRLLWQTSGANSCCHIRSLSCG